MHTNPNAEDIDELIQQVEESLKGMSGTDDIPPWVAKIPNLRDSFEIVSNGIVDLKIAMMTEALEDGFDNMNEEQALYYNAVHSDLFEGLFVGWGARIQSLSAQIKAGLTTVQAGEELRQFLSDLDSYLSKDHVSALSDNVWTEDFLAPLNKTISEIRTLL